MTNHITRKTTVLFLIMALSLGLFPVSSYAHDNDQEDERDSRDGQSALHRNDSDRHDNDDDDDDRDGDHEDDNDDRSERKDENNENKSCRKAFKKLFKSGNLGENSADFYIECLKPFGFEATFHGTTTPTTDTTAPVITDLAVTPATTTATINWHTNEKSDSTVFWSTSHIDLNSSSTASTTNSNKTKNHNLVLNGLNASTTYFVIVRSRDASSNTGTSSEISFHTNSPIPVPPDTTSPIISAVATQASSSSIQVSWNTNEPATSKIFYSTSSALDVNSTSTSFMENVTLTLNHLISFVSLLPQTVYYFIVRSVDGSGNAATSTLITATTTAVI